MMFAVMIRHENPVRSRIRWRVLSVKNKVFRLLKTYGTVSCYSFHPVNSPIFSTDIIIRLTLILSFLFHLSLQLFLKSFLFQLIPYNIFSLVHSIPNKKIHFCIDSTLFDKNTNKKD